MFTIEAKLYPSSSYQLVFETNQRKHNETWPALIFISFILHKR